MFPSFNGREPAAINLQRLSAVDEYKDIIINDVKYSAFADTDDFLQPHTIVILKKQNVAVFYNLIYKEKPRRPKGKTACNRMYTNIKNETVKLPKIQWVWQIA